MGSEPSKEVQLEYVKGMVPLMLWYMRLVMGRWQIPFSLALTDYVDIYRKTSYFNLNDASETCANRSAWETLVGKMEAALHDCFSGGNATTYMEQKGLELLWPSLSERIERGLPLVEFRDETSFGCFFYILEDEAVDLHFVNKVMPESPFKNPLDRARELLRLVEHCQEIRPDLQRIKFGSWLNAYAPFNRLFPPVFKDTGERKKYNSIGWWGQFVSHRGDFHSLNAAKFRANGDFPYQFTFNQWELADLKKHLTGILS